MQKDWNQEQEKEEQVENLLNDADDLSSLHWISTAPAFRFDLSPERGNLLRHLQFQGLEVLELGGGMGGLSRSLAERAKTLTVVEGSEHKLKVLSERLRDLPHTAILSSVAALKLEKKFDVVCAVGGSDHAQLTVKRAKEFLKEGGVLIFAVENQLALKDWNAAPDTKTDLLFQGIAGFSPIHSASAFSRKSLKTLVEQNGFVKIAEYFPFPDFRFPTSILSTLAPAVYPELSADLATHEPLRSDTFSLFPETLATHTVAKAGMLSEFSPAFLLVAAQTADSPVFQQLGPKEGAFAWHYSLNRKWPTQTVFRQLSSGKVQVEKIALKSPPRELSSQALNVRWNGAPLQPLETGERLRLRLLRSAHFEGIEKLVEELQTFLQWSFEKWKIEEAVADISGKALDAVYSNALLVPNDGKAPFSYRLFDLEWELQGKMPPSWFVLRNVLLLNKDFSILRPTADLFSLETLYLFLCDSLGISSNFLRDISLEAEFQSLVAPETSKQAFEGAITHCLRRPLEKHGYFREAAWESRLRTNALTLHEKAPHLLNAFDRLLPRLFFRAEAFLRESKRLRRLLTQMKSRTQKVYRLWPALYQAALLQKGTHPNETGEVLRRFGALPKTGWVRVQASLDTGAGTLTELTLGLRIKGKLQRVSLHRNWLGSFSRVLKLSHPAEALSFEVDPKSPAGQVVAIQSRNLTKGEAALRLIAPQVPSLLFTAQKRQTFFARLQALWKQGKLRGLAACLHQQALAGNVGFIEEYSAWIEEFEKISPRDEEEIRVHIQELSFFPLISILLPVYNPEPRWLREALDSVLAQKYPHWELCIADDGSSNPVIREVLEEYRHKDARIHVVYRMKNGHISRASNSALSIASGEFFTLLDHDDTLSPLALYFVAAALNKNRDLKFIYSDEDKIDDKGRRYLPHFKTDWNRELFYSYNLFTHLSVMRTPHVKDLGGFREGFEGSQDYDLFLRYIETVSEKEIHHIPRVLYHWRAIENSTSLSSTTKPYAFLAAEKALTEHLQRRGIKATVEKGVNDTHKISYSLPETLPKVSVVLCTRDRADLLRNIIEDLTTRTDYKPLEIVVIDNQSREEGTLSYLEECRQREHFKVLPYDDVFNFSAMNNLGVSHASGEFVLLLNNDIRTLRADWLKEMVKLALLPETGAVGARLLYPSHRIQHAGVILGIGGVAGHSHKGFSQHAVDFYARTRVPQWISAVTGACLLVKKTLYVQVGGLDAEHLTVAFNDVDFCLKLREAGYKNIYTPHAELYHLESESRGSDQRPETFPRFQKEEAFMKRKWGNILKRDPFYNPNLTLEAEDFSLSFPPRTIQPWKEHRKSKRLRSPGSVSPRASSDVSPQV